MLRYVFPSKLHLSGALTHIDVAAFKTHITLAQYCESPWH